MHAEEYLNYFYKNKSLIYIIYNLYIHNPYELFNVLEWLLNR